LAANESAKDSGSISTAEMAAAGVSSSQLYHYFADKHALVLAVIAHQTQAILDDQQPLLAHAANPDDLALAILAALQGGLLLTQIRRETKPLEVALDTMLDHIASLTRPR
jgi:AcrR family transcriptional regulator